MVRHSVLGSDPAFCSFLYSATSRVLIRESCILISRIYIKKLRPDNQSPAHTKTLGIESVYTLLRFNSMGVSMCKQLSARIGMCVCGTITCIIFYF